MDAEKLAKLKANVRIGGKGTPRRKVKRTVKSDGDDTKVQAALAKLNAQTVTGVEQVNLFSEDGSVIHFGRPAVQQASQYNTFAIHGLSTQKSMAEALPDVVSSMGPEATAQLRKLTEALQKHQEANKANGEEASEVPKLIDGQTFDNVE